MSASDKAALGAWLDEDVRHGEVLLEVAAVWDKTDALARLADLFPHDAAHRWGIARPPASALGTGPRRCRGSGSAGDQWLVVRESRRQRNTANEVRRVRDGHRRPEGRCCCPDGSEVVLNTHSRLEGDAHAVGARTPLDARRDFGSGRQRPRPTAVRGRRRSDHSSHRHRVCGGNHG